jgi:hypothetical protein
MTGLIRYDAACRALAEATPSSVIGAVVDLLGQRREPWRTIRRGGKQ